ncbi:MAG: trimethylamine methyltransferase family protein, partial [Acidimicrobiia bacterium]
MDTSTDPTPRERRRKRSQDLSPAPPRSERYRHIVNPFEPARILSDDQVDAIHAAAIKLLAEVGMRVLHPEARSLLAAAGARVSESDELVHFDPDLVAASVAAAPARFDIRSRNSERDVAMGGTSVAFFPVAGPPHSIDLDRSRRAGSLSEFEDFTKLTQTYDVLHGLSPTVEPQDVPLEERHLQMTLSQLSLSDKVPFIYCRGRAQVADCLEMIRLVSGLEQGDFGREP